MTSENAARRGSAGPENNFREHAADLRALPVRLEAVHAGYLTKLARAPLAEQTRRTYASKVRGYLAWLAEADVDGDPLTDPDARDWAVRDYRTHLAAVLKRSNATVKLATRSILQLPGSRRSARSAGERA